MSANRDQVLGRIKRILKQPDAVIFVGSGISVWSGLPSWKRLLEDLADYLHSSGLDATLVLQEVEAGDYLQAASYGFDVLTKTQIAEFIRKACRFGEAKPHEVHRLISTLGPKCFITTNYDDLIEQSVRTWLPSEIFPAPITNNTILEAAEASQASSTNYIFKPHGDLGDTDSLILSREQYRSLLPQGDKHAALDALKTILVSRPIVYFGFGLKDPDFLYLRDILSNIYRGSVRDHYAVLPDVTHGQIEYWKKNYGIHLVGYETSKLPDNSVSHKSLIDLLNRLHEEREHKSDTSAETSLKLIRHAESLTEFKSAANEFLIRVREKGCEERYFRQRHSNFDYMTSEDFLLSGPKRAILLGPPGAGKSYALRKAAMLLAKSLREACLSTSEGKNRYVVPVLVDMKVYGGSIVELIKTKFPPSICLQHAKKNFELVLIVDSFNEMPRAYLEDASYERDFSDFLDDFSTSRIILASRTSDGLEKFDLPVFSLSEIDYSVVEESLEERGIETSGPFGIEFIDLFRKPFYYRLLDELNILDLCITKPKQIYESIVLKLDSDFSSRFREVDLLSALKETAFRSMDAGQEAFDVGILYGELSNTHLPQGTTTTDIINWLISKSILVPQSRSRVSFFHQSITEYLAALKLSEALSSSEKFDPAKILNLPRWNQSIMLAISLLEESEANKLFSFILDRDIRLSLNAIKYVEFGSPSLVDRLLDTLPSRLEFFPVHCGPEWLLCNVPYTTESHEKKLRALMEMGGELEVAATDALVRFIGPSIKGEMLTKMSSSPDDYNLCCNGIARALEELIEEQDLPLIMASIDQVSALLFSDPDIEVDGFVAGIATLLRSLPWSIVRPHFWSDERKIPESLWSRILCELSQDMKTDDGLALSCELLSEGYLQAATSIFFNLKFARSPLNVQPATRKHGEILIAAIDSGVDSDAWVVPALRCLCKEVPEILDLTTSEAANSSGLREAILLYCTSPDASAILKFMRHFISRKVEDRDRSGLHLLGSLDIDWPSEKDLVLELILDNDEELLRILIGGSNEFDEVHLATEDLNEIEPLLSIMNSSDQYMLRSSIGALLANSDEVIVRQCIDEFNKADTPYRCILSQFVLARLSRLSTDELSDVAIEYLLDQLLNGERASFEGNVLGKACTEAFAKERLLPLWEARKDANVAIALRDAGSRHGCRYISV
ncbi:SIR2 family protein [Pseudoxanthomonas sp.]|uniref:SIR2 family protein n=1 Tax=Pseudoxanthomonas sp. TaxID=1871049 RepID=UPI0025EBDD1B|nr:SIR2 family protein [Pseudoxanthomonas sp.]